MKKQIAAYFKVEEKQVSDFKIRNKAVSVLIDYGIAGMQKFSLSLADLEPAEEPAPKEATVLEKATQAVQRAKRRRTRKKD